MDHELLCVNQPLAPLNISIIPVRKRCRYKKILHKYFDFIMYTFFSAARSHVMNGFIEDAQNNIILICFLFTKYAYLLA